MLGRYAEAERPVTALAWGLGAGMATAGLIVLVGTTAAAIVALVLAVVALAWGGVDYVRSHD